MTKPQIWNLYETYVEAWKLTSNEEREKVVAQITDDSIQYLTPEFQGGREAILNDMESFQKKFPGGHFAIDDISTHHDVALFTWALVLADGTVPAKGHDQLRISPDGKIASITTFAPSSPKPLSE